MKIKAVRRAICLRFAVYMLIAGAPYSSLARADECRLLFDRTDVSHNLKSADQLTLTKAQDVIAQRFSRSDYLELLRVCDPHLINEINVNQSIAGLVKASLQAIVKKPDSIEIFRRLSDQFRIQRPGVSKDETLSIEALVQIDRADSSSLNSTSPSVAKIEMQKAPDQQVIRKAISTMTSSFSRDDLLSVAMQLNLITAINAEQSANGIAKNLIEVIMADAARTNKFQRLSDVYRQSRTARSADDKASIDQLIQIQPILSDGAELGNQPFDRISSQTKEDREAMSAAVKIIEISLDDRRLRTVIERMNPEIPTRIFWEQSKHQIIIELFNLILKPNIYKENIGQLVATIQLVAPQLYNAHTEVFAALVKIEPRQVLALPQNHHPQFVTFSVSDRKKISSVSSLLASKFDTNEIKYLAAKIDQELETRLYFRQPRALLALDLIDAIFNSSSRKRQLQIMVEIVSHERPQLREQEKLALEQISLVEPLHAQ